MKFKSYTTIVGCLAISLMACLLCGCDDDTLEPDDKPILMLSGTSWHGNASYLYVGSGNSLREISMSFVGGKVESTPNADHKTREVGKAYLSDPLYPNGGIKECDYLYEGNVLQLSIRFMNGDRLESVKEYLFVVKEFSSEALHLWDINEQYNTPYATIYFSRVR